MLALALRTVEFLFYHLLLSLVDRVSRLPRDSSTMPEVMRLYRENVGLKAQIEALERHILFLEGKKKPQRVGLGLRAAQVFAYFLTRGNEPFQRYFLSAPLGTILRWATRFRSLRRRLPVGGRPPLDDAIVQLILTLKRENPPWGQRRIREELRRMGIRVSEPTIGRVLAEHGFPPRKLPFKKLDFERVRAAAKDALWALDFFAVRTAKGVWLQALLVIDVYTRELLDIRVYDGWDVDSAWTIRALDAIIGRTKRQPLKVVHDHGMHFRGQFERQLRVVGVEEEVTPCGIPEMNGFAERAIRSVRCELLRHIRFADAAQAQWFLDEYRRYANTERPHQGLDGRTPEEIATAAPEAPVIDLAAVRSRRLVRRAYAHGLLQGYALVEQDAARAAA